MPTKILLIRLSAIGDIVMASPLIGALRSSYPDARISWLVQRESQALLDRHPDLDEVLIWPRQEWQHLAKHRQWLSLYREIRRFKQELQIKGFDITIDLQGLMKSGFLAWLSGARERIGLGSREGSQWLMSRVIDRGGDSQRIGSEYLYLAQQLDLHIEPFLMHIALADADEDYVRNLITSQRLNAGYLVTCPFTTRPQKHWFEEQWLELIPRLQESLGMRVLMLGGPGDQRAAQQMVDRLHDSLIDMVGVTSLRQAAALIKHAALLIGVDTGLTHMGIAFNRPTICLFGSTCPYLDTTRENALVLYHKLACSPCKRKPTCNGRFDCMRAISVDEVLEHADRLLRREPRPL
ncbi:MAG: glycosyltransferase family 9 protein [Gammaproteobacteria bacterium]|nr:glycosyltransferase family 9 protein [Gammaproteobacteria bacterium]